MLIRKFMPVLLLAILIPLQIFSNGNQPPSRYESILQAIGRMLEQGHFSPAAIDDAFSKKVFDKYFDNLDPNKYLFLASDLNALQPYATQIDDEIHGAPLDFFSKSNEIYEKRVLEAEILYKELLAKPFDFKQTEDFVDEPDQTHFPADEQERKEVWRKTLKYYVLERYLDQVEQKDSTLTPQAMAEKMDEGAESEARDKVMHIMDRYFRRLRQDFDEEKRFSMLVNTITNLMDPHTDYFPPVEKREFDERLSGRFYGIGALLQQVDEKIKIAELTPGAPAWKSGDVEVGDVIAKVAQYNEPAVDVTGYDMDEVIKLIRGKKDTKVTVTFKKTNGSLKSVTMVRDELKLDETFAKSAVITTTDQKRIGYIYLPKFYADFEKTEGASCAADIAKELKKLQAENIDGVVLDIRNNGGGSLREVVRMVGLFIKDGPVVQVRDRYEDPEVLGDTDTSITYTGPLVVMVNELSASASEIFAAAIQDYHRGVIVGSSSTYGKGTVQQAFNVNRFAGIPQEDLGALHLTLQKYYRINGGSTQLKGVTPDIILPGLYEHYDYREKDNTSALPWDEIRKQNYRAWDHMPALGQLKTQSNLRLQTHAAFLAIDSCSALLSQLNRNPVPLDIVRYKSLESQRESLIKRLNNLKKSEDTLQVDFLKADQLLATAEPSRVERNNRWLADLRNDIYLDEAVRIMMDVCAVKIP